MGVVGGEGNAIGQTKRASVTRTFRRGTARDLPASPNQAYNAHRSGQIRGAGFCQRHIGKIAVKRRAYPILRVPHLVALGDKLASLPTALWCSCSRLLPAGTLTVLASGTADEATQVCEGQPGFRLPPQPTARRSSHACSFPLRRQQTFSSMNSLLLRSEACRARARVACTARRRLAARVR